MKREVTSKPLGQCSDGCHGESKGGWHSFGWTSIDNGTSEEECVWSKWNQMSRGLVPSSCYFSSWKVEGGKGCCLGMMGALVNRAHSSHCLEGRCEGVTGLFLKCNKVEINWRSAWIVSWSLDLQESNNLGRNSEQLNNVIKDHPSYFSSFCPIFLPLALSH